MQRGRDKDPLAMAGREEDARGRLIYSTLLLLG